MRTTTTATLLAALIAVPGVAHAAAPGGSYKGVSTGKVWDRAAMDDVVDKGTVTFSVRSNVVRSFRLTGQKFMCGGQPVEVKVAAAKIKLNSSGRGTATYSNDLLGSFKISITVKSTGRASGTITPKNLCSDDYGVKFTAKKR